MSADWARLINSSSLMLSGATWKSFIADIHCHRHAGQDLVGLDAARVLPDAAALASMRAFPMLRDSLIMWRSMKRTKQFPRLISFAAGILLLSSACSRPPAPARQPSARPADAPGSQTLTGRVVRVADGDTVTVLD